MRGTPTTCCASTTSMPNAAAMTLAPSTTIDRRMTSRWPPLNCSGCADQDAVTFAGRHIDALVDEVLYQSRLVAVAQDDHADTTVRVGGVLGEAVQFVDDGLCLRPDHFGEAGLQQFVQVGLEIEAFALPGFEAVMRSSKNLSGPVMLTVAVERGALAVVPDDDDGTPTHAARRCRAEWRPTGSCPPHGTVLLPRLELESAVRDLVTAAASDRTSATARVQARAQFP